MDEYDIVVVGGGSGSQVATAAAETGLEAAVVEPGPLGGTCITRGCVPSKALIHRADLLEEIRHAEAFGIPADVGEIDYGAITDAIHDTVYEKADRQEASLEDASNVTRYRGEGRFLDDRTLEVALNEDAATGDAAGDSIEIRADTIVLAVGSRPMVPPIDGLDEVDFLTSEDALFLDDQPDSLVIVGGGYIGAELGYFFGALGTDVSMVGRSETLVPREDDDVSEFVTDSLEDYCAVYAGYEANEVDQREDQTVVTAVPANDGGEGGNGDGDSDDSVELAADDLLLATGRRPNTDTLALENTGVEVDDQGHVETDDRLETTVDDVWALGDILGEEPYKHAADYETRIVTANVLGDGATVPEDGETGSALDEGGRTVDYSAMPHAIFTTPQVASVGQTTGELEASGIEYESTSVPFDAAPLGLIREAEGFVKVLAAPDGEILGCHIVGPDASTLIQEVVVAMDAGDGTVDDVADSVHVHPALSEVVYAAFDEASSSRFSTAPDWRDVR
ncbi:dihydrolipoyl dehydrogenase [Natronorubrum daqingense]|uniref:Dihydrolipoamide dehydrogenase n=1 Tax=Natronorubrum daqingense TaxID=588898 RepID=A0A1N7FTG4_9EURY|nr:dihydrolipoyl dehydrogenase [Natronorubrum daqingense]APX97406.1 dihydrolipoamide dehydrogenase [Natronorubrum daqingense]SIS03525.1 dihydrolipoamide dehydrogenase [Natronorubrum daqingense]